MTNSQSKNSPTLVGVMAAVALVGVAAAAILADVDTGGISLNRLLPIALAIGVFVVAGFVIVIARMVTAQGVLPQLDEAFSLLNFQRTTAGEGLWQYNGQINAQNVSVMLHPGPVVEIEVEETLRSSARISPARGTTPGTDSGDLSYLLITSADQAWTQTILGDEEIRESLKTLLPNDPIANTREIMVRSQHLSIRIDIQRGKVNPDEVRQWVYDTANLAKSLAEYAPEVDPAISVEKYHTLDDIKAMQASKSGNSPQTKAAAAVTIAISIALVVLGLVMSVMLASN